MPLCLHLVFSFRVFFFNDTAPTEIYTLSLHDALPIYAPRGPAERRLGRRTERLALPVARRRDPRVHAARSEEHTSELQSLRHLVCRLLLEKKKKRKREEQSVILTKNKTT